MSKEDLKVTPVAQEVTNEDLKKVNGGGPYDVPTPNNGCRGKCFTKD